MLLGVYTAAHNFLHPPALPFLVLPLPLVQLPLNELFELPGRPHVVYQIRSYENLGSLAEAAAQARSDMPFLFKAFETGQVGVC